MIGIATHFALDRQQKYAVTPLLHCEQDEACPGHKPI
jgi:hypothetical protein